MFKRIIVALGLLVVFNSAYSQDSKSQQILSVTLDVGGKGAPTYCAKLRKHDYYFATVNVLNTQDTAVSIWVMSCSWTFDGFVINNDSIRVTYCYLGCDYNVPEEIRIPAKKSVQFYNTISSRKKDPSIPRVKVGFKYFRTGADLWNANASKESERPYTMIWSNEVELKDKMYTYEIK